MESETSSCYMGNVGAYNLFSFSNTYTSRYKIMQFYVTLRNNENEHFGDIFFKYCVISDR